MTVTCYASRRIPPPAYRRLDINGRPGPYHLRIVSAEVFFCPWCCGQINEIPWEVHERMLCPSCHRPFRAAWLPIGDLETVALFDD